MTEHVNDNNDLNNDVGLEYTFVKYYVLYMYVYIFLFYDTLSLFLLCVIK